MLSRLLIFLKYYLPLLIWAGVIFYLSSIPGLRYSKSAITEIILRKGAHFGEFFLLTFLFWRIFWKGHGIKSKKAYWLTLIFAGLYGFFDEFHQTLVSGRTGKFIDAWFDFFSVVFCLEIIFIYIKKNFSWKNFLILAFSALILLGLEIKMIKDGVSDEKKPISLILKNEINKIKNDLESRILNGKVQNNETGNEIGKQAELILENKNDIKEQDVSEDIPEKVIIDVPFASQAPFKNWDEIHEEACEEASIIMLKYYLENKKLAPEIAEKEIQDLVKFQMEKNGDYKDTTARETADLFLDFYGEPKDGKKIKVVYDFPKDDLKKYLARGNPIIIPAAGRKLGNPNFKTPGPLYHNLVLVGYNGDTIITNDPGTRKGEGYIYNIDVLYGAIHDFPGKPENIEQGRKAMIIVE